MDQNRWSSLASPHASGFFALFEIPGMSLAVCLKERSYHNHRQEPVFSIDPKTQNTKLLLTNHTTTQFQPNPIKNIIVYVFYHLVLLDFPIGSEFHEKLSQKVYNCVQAYIGLTSIHCKLYCVCLILISQVPRRLLK